jgi:hypothetical protein
MVTKRERITEKALELLKAAPNGLRRADLVAQLRAAYPDDTLGSIRGIIWDLDVRLPDIVAKPSRAVFCLAEYPVATKP